MRIVEQISDEAVSEEALARFQAKIVLPIPEAYLEFLRRNNGGRPEPAVFRFTDGEGKPTKCKVHYFFGLHSGPIGNLVKEFELYSDRVPLGLLPIGRDAFGNLILLKLMRKVAPVFFWDHELEDDDSPTMANVFRISSSLDEFIQSLTMD